MKLPIQSQPVSRKASMTRTYQKLTDGIIPSLSCPECQWKLDLCGIETGIDFSISSLSTLNRMRKGEYNWAEPCKSYYNECGHCAFKPGTHNIIL